MDLENCKKQLERLQGYKIDAIKSIEANEIKIENSRREIKRYVVCLMISVIFLALIVSCIFVPQMRDFVLNLLKIDFNKYVIISLDTLKLLTIYLLWCILQAILMATAIKYDEFSDTIGIALIFGVFSYIYFIKEHPITFISNNKDEIARIKKRYEEILLEIEQEEKRKTELEAVMVEAESYYKKALESNDEELMKKASILGEKNAIAYFETKAAAEKARQDIKKAEELFALAHNNKKVNWNILEQAADLGHKEACSEMARYLIEEYCSEEYTASEKVDLVKKAATYLEDLDKSKDIELEFIWVFSNSMSNWVDDTERMQEALLRIREIKKTGELQDKYEKLASVCASTLVSFIDKTDSFSEELKVNKPQEVQFDSSKVICRYFANGVCGYKSSSAIIEHCYRDDGTWSICPHYKNRVF